MRCLAEKLGSSESEPAWQRAIKFTRYGGQADVVGAGAAMD
ncbi:MAG: hypothetical protein PHQ35_06785 [Phycisphaerae bacterium]|nr:hypothetical protein [Phycisphaerae bacterium]MDD5381089.1 hypothetical protein [Phycisphaerae bacterium]